MTEEIREIHDYIREVKVEKLQQMIGDPRVSLAEFALRVVWGANWPDEWQWKTPMPFVVTGVITFMGAFGLWWWTARR